MNHGVSRAEPVDATRSEANHQVSLPVLSNRSRTTGAGTPNRVNRRSFLRGFCAATGACAVGATATPARATPGTRAASDHWMGVLVDLTKCVGCRKCEWACRKANGLSDGEPIDAYEDESVFEHRRRPNARHLTVVNRFTPPDHDGGSPVHAKVQCMHCFEPACASACPANAYRKSSQGPVVYDPSVCIGCRYCLVACPFGMPAYSYDDPLTPEVRKCSMCFERIAKEGGRPECVDICPVEALTFGKRNELIELARRKIAEHPDTYVDHIYGEYEAGGTCWLYLSPVPFDQVGFRTDVGESPYPELTRGFGNIVQLVMATWPALLMGAYAFTKRREQLALEQVASTRTSTPGEEHHDG